MLDRDELAARYFAVILTPLVGDEPAHEWDMSKMAGAAVAAADALLAALVPVAPASGAPLAAPSPSPAATPAAWVPSVGDVVKHVSESDAVATTGQIRVVVSTNPIRWVYVENGVRKGESGPTGWGNDVRFVRRATSSERAAAGLPVDVEDPRSGDDRPASGQSAAKPVDREGLIAAMNKAARLWVDSDDKRSLAECHADAAIAFMAKGCAS